MGNAKSNKMKMANTTSSVVYFNNINDVINPNLHQIQTKYNKRSKTIQMDKDIHRSLNEDDMLLVFGYIRLFIEWQLKLKAKQSNYQYQLIIPNSINRLCLNYVGSVLFSSKILTIAERQKFTEFIQTKINSVSSNINKRYGFQLLYRGSLHGFTSNAFHSLCDNQGELIIFIYTNYNFVFGAYTSKSYTSSGKFQEDWDSFLFLIRNGYEYKRNVDAQEIQCSDIKFSRYAVHHSASNGPSFGTDDLIIYDKCNESQKNICEIGEAFKFSIGDVKYLGGSKRFRVIDYEVFTTYVR